MSPHGCPKMSAKLCNRNAEESFPVLSLKSWEQKPPNPLLIQDKNVLQPSHTPRADAAGTQTHGPRRVVGGHTLSPRGRGHGGGASLAGCPRSGCPLWVSLLSDPDVGGA